MVLSAGVLTLERVELRGWPGPAVAVSGGRLTLRHSVLAENAGQGAVRVTGGAVLIEDSTLETNTGGAIFASDGELSLQRSTVTANSAARGGGVHVEGAAVVQVNATRVAQNSASVSGGGFSVAAGTLVLSGGTMLEGNSAARQEHRRQECPAALTAHCRVWAAGASRALGLRLQRTALARDRPSACWRDRIIPGGGRGGRLPVCVRPVFGAEGDIDGQSGPSCSGACPAGFSCGSATVTPAPCDVPGTYCPEGSPVATPCPPGQTSNRTRMTSVDECESCPRGHWCSQGVKVPCGSGTYNAFEGGNVLSDCVPCPDESISDVKSTSLDACQCREGHYASWLNGTLTCESCPEKSTSEPASISLSQCQCEPGQYASWLDGSFTCTPCPIGAACENPGAQLATLPLQEGFWRNHSNTTDVRRCRAAQRLALRRLLGRSVCARRQQLHLQGRDARPVVHAVR